jgi:peptidyl-prolyl cis-trans isomerase B (cyclophilin B)
MMTPVSRRVVGLAGLLALLVFAPFAGAQLAPDRLYYGINRKIPMQVSASGGEVEIRLLRPEGGEVVATAAAAPGGVDLAGLFPVLWETPQPEVLYAQVFVDGVATGPAVVLDPMVSVDKATLLDPQTMTPSNDPRRSMPVFESDRMRMLGQAPRPRTYSGLRAYVDRDVVLETTMGDIRIRLRPDKAPNSAFNFRSLAAGGYYTDIIFHRIIPARAGRPGFVIQVGDPTGTGSGGPGYEIDLEKSDLLHDFGVISMARSGDPDSGGSQVFICLSREATASLDGRYTAFGQAIAGADTIGALGSVEVQGDRPVDPPVLSRAYLVDAAPFGTGPMPVKASGTVEPAPSDR